MCIGRLSFWCRCKWIEIEKNVSIDVHPQLLNIYSYLFRYFATLSRLFLRATGGKTTVRSAGIELAVCREARYSQAQQDHTYEQRFFRFHHFKFEMNK